MCHLRRLLETDAACELVVARESDSALSRKAKNRRLKAKDTAVGPPLVICAIDGRGMSVCGRRGGRETLNSGLARSALASLGRVTSVHSRASLRSQSLESIVAKTRREPAKIIDIIAGL